MSETPTSTFASDLVGGRYRLLAEVGRGGMATVHHARDEVLDRDVALKILHGHLADDPAFLQRFLREARAAAGLSHPNILAVYDWGESDDHAYMVLELVHGMSLREAMRVRGRLTPAEALALLGPAAAGLGAAHDAGLVHRDVKPENVLIGDDGVVKLSDFGLARAAASSTQTFGADVIVGSPHYLAPEAVTGDGTVGATADVYALGIVLYEALTGRPPFQADTPLATAMLHTSETVPAPSSRVPGVSPGLDRVVRCATDPDPAQRYADGAAFARALASAVPEGPASIDLRDGTRDTVVLPTHATDTLVGLGAPVPVSATEITPRSPAEATPAEEGAAPPRRRRWRRVLLALLLLGALSGGGWLTYDQVLAPVESIPGVERLPGSVARDRLIAAGFDVDVDDDRPYSRDIPEDHVISWEPTERARRGTTVTLVLSAGPRPIDLPDVAGQTEEEATATIEGLGLEVEVAHTYHGEVEAGRVVSTDPTGPTVVDDGSAVTLTVSQGREPVEVASVVGERQDRAEAILGDAGLVPTVVGRIYHDDVPEGAVVSQSPGAGETILRGDTVELVVSRGPAPVEVPRVLGMKEDQARQELGKVGLHADVVYVETILPWRSGDVHEQDPEPGTQIRKGDTVTLYVWR